MRKLDTFSVSAFTNPIQLYRSTATRQWDMLDTRVALRFDYANRSAQGEAWLHLSPYFYPCDSLILDAKSMIIHSISVGAEKSVLTYRYDSTQLLIKLNRTYRQGEILQLNIKYTALPYARLSQGSQAIAEDRGLYFINHDSSIVGKPRQIWTQGETEANSHWLPCIDKPNSRTKIQLELTVPNQYKTLSNGALISSTVKDSLRTDIWRNEEPIQLYALMFAIGDFAVTKQEWRNKEVSYYVEPNYAPYAQTMFQNTPEMLEFFSNITGVDYPWHKYSQIVVRDYVSGAMENTSASLFGEFMNQNKREYADANFEDVVSHELFHQWFGDYVTAESWSHLTVNESFATYGEYLWRKYKYGLAYADQLAYDDLNKYLDYTGFSDPALVRHYYRDREDMFDRVSYQKGGAILRYLHHLIGDSAFYKSMKIYLSKNALQAAEATHWRLAVEEATGQDWSWFFNQWYYKAGHPKLDIKYQYDDAAAELKVEVFQTQNNGVYRLPLSCALIYGKEKIILSWDITKAKHTFVYPYQDGKKPILVPDVVHVLPGTIKEDKKPEEYLQQLRNTEDYVSKLQSILSVKTRAITNPVVQEIITEGLQDKIAAIKEQTLQLLSNVVSKNLQDKWSPTILMMAQHDGHIQTRAAAIDLIGLWRMQGQEELLTSLVHDSSYLVAGNALRALSLLNEKLAYQLAKTHLNEKANTHLDEWAWAIVSRNAKDEDTVLMATIAVHPTDQQRRTHLRDDLLLFANNTSNNLIFEKCLTWLATLINSTANKNYRSYYATSLFNIKETLQLRLKKDTKNSLLKQRMNMLHKTITELSRNEQDIQLQEQYRTML